MKTANDLIAAAISRSVLLVLVVVLSVIVASGSYAIYTSGRNPNPSTVTESAVQIIEPLAYQHWQSIGTRNVSAIMSGYSHYYEDVWWFFNGSSALSAIN